VGPWFWKNLRYQPMETGSTSWYVSQGLASGSSTRRGLPSVMRGFPASKDQRAALAPPPAISFSTSASDAMEVSPAVVIARAP
jgi:hypothetical protein